MAETECALISRVTQLAQEKEFIPRGDSIKCDFAPLCNGLRCLLQEKLQSNPMTLTLYLTQGKNGHVPSGEERFYRRLFQTAALLNLEIPSET